MAQDNWQNQGGVGVKEQTIITVRPPQQYRVVMLNDDVTTMDFVVMVLQQVFRKSMADATSLMMKIHTTGQAVVGVYSYDIAVTLKQKAVNLARVNGFPLQLRVVPDEE